MSNLWFEVKWHFYIHWGIYVIIAIIFLMGTVMVYLPNDRRANRPPAVVTTLAEGTIVGIRATGAWENWCKIELKFDNGTVLLVSYNFIKKYNIREGRQYRIQRNSYIGETATETK